MEEVFKEAAKKAPVVTAVLVFVLLIAAEFFKKDIPYWGWIIFVIGCLLLTYLIIFFNSYKKDKNSVKVSEQKITDVVTEGGDFTMGAHGKSPTKVVIDGGEIKGVKTGGGNFTVGKRE